MIKPFLKGIFSFVASIALQLVSFGAGIYCAKELPLQMFGALSLLKTLFIYSAFTTLGITESILYELPIILAKKDAAQIKLNQNVFFTASFASLSFVLIFFFFALGKVSLNDIPLSWEWILVGLIVFTSSITAHSMVLYMAYQRFVELAYFKLIYAIAFGALLFFLLPKYLLAGFLIAILCGNLFRMVLSFNFIKDKIGFSWDYRKAFEHIKNGLPIRATGFLWALFLSVDLWFVSLFISTESAGLYGFAVLAGTAFQVIPVFLGQFVQPRLSSYFGKVDGDKTRLASPYQNILLSFLSVGIVASTLVMIFFHFLIHLYLPQYLPLLGIIPILLCGYQVASIMAIGVSLLILFKKQIQILKISAGMLVFVIILDLIAAKVYQSLFLIALSTAVGLALNGIAIFNLLLKNLKVENKSLFILKTTLLILGGIASIGLCYGILKYSGDNYLNGILLIPIFLIIVPLHFSVKKFFKFWKMTSHV